jgi:hypothetical protein
MRSVTRLAIVARLRDGAHEQAARLLAGGPPFDPADVGFERHAVYLSSDEVVFVFEGTDVEWELDDLVSDYFHPLVRAALESWRPLLESDPHIARGVFFWERASEDKETT